MERTGQGWTAYSRVRLDLPPALVRERLFALRNHERLIPLTVIRVPDRPLRRGDVGVAVTAGVIRDEMVVTDALRAPDGGGRLVLEKIGPVLIGAAGLAITPVGAGAEVTWWERASLRGPWRDAVAPAVTGALGLMTDAALRRFRTLTR